MEESQDKSRKIKGYQMLLIVSIVLVLLGGLFAGFIQSSFGKIAVEDVKFPTRDGQWVTADLYKPKTATHDNKAPLIVVVAGFQRTRETQANIALELSRRGFVVINIDPYSQGDSSSSAGRESGAIATAEGYGAYDLINYIYDSKVLNYVDTSRIGITGHSAGGNAAYQMAVKFGRESVENGGVSKVQAAYISGYVLSFGESIKYAKSNIGFDYALYDEGAFRNAAVLNPENPEEEAKPTANMTIAKESHIFVNSVLTTELADSDLVEMGKVYGNPKLRTMRQVFNTPTIHAFQPYSSQANTSLLSFFEVAMEFDYSISADSHVWWVKEVFTTIALIGAFMFIVPFAKLLMKIPFFESVKTPVPEPVARRTSRQRILFWVTFAINALIAGLTFIPLSKLTLVFFPKATGSIMTWWFPQRMNNAVLVWAVFNGILGMVVFLGVYFGTYYIKKALHKWSLKNKTDLETPIVSSVASNQDLVYETGNVTNMTANADNSLDKKQSKLSVAKIKTKKIVLKTLGSDMPEPLTTEPWGLKIKPINLLKTFLLALCVFGGFYGLLHLNYFLFGTDFRFLFLISARPLNLKVVLQALMYIPLFFIFYLSNSIRVNGNMREKGQKEWLSLIIVGLANSIGLIIILAIQYICFYNTGTVYWTETATKMTEWLYVNILFGLVPLMFVLPMFNRWFFRASGKSWLGPMVMCMIFITMMLNNSVAYIPL